MVGLPTTSQRDPARARRTPAHHNARASTTRRAARAHRSPAARAARRSQRACPGQLPNPDHRSGPAGTPEHPPARRACRTERLHARPALRTRDRVGRRAAGRGRRRASLHRGRVRTFQRHRAAGRLDRRRSGEPIRHRYTPAATAASTRPFTGWPSRSSAASHAPRRSTPTPAPTRHTPKRKPARVLKRHLSDVVYRRMIRHLAASEPAQPSSLTYPARSPRSQEWPDRAE